MRELHISSAVAVLAVCLAVPANAQVAEPQAQRDDQLQEIVVTAQKRAESLQRTPVSVTALGEGILQERSISSVADLQGSVPGLVIGGNANFGGINSIVFRGVSSPNLVIGAEEAVGVYVDGVFLPRSDAAFFNFADVERIEALRGPQGTLYGRNSVAGAINILTRSPEDALEGKLEANYGSFNKYEVKAYVGGPIASGVAASVSVVKSGHTGYFTNANTGNKVGKQDDITARAKLMFRGDRIRVTVAGDYSLLKADDVFKNIKDVSGAVIGFGDPGVVATEIEDLIFARRESYGISLTAAFEASDSLTLTSISSRRWYRATNFTDTDGQGTATPFARTRGGVGNDDFNQELRANLVTDSLAVTAGLNYFQDTSYTSVENIGPTGRTGLNILDSKTKAYAAFAQAEWEVDPGLKLIAGARYNIDEKYFSVTQPPLGALGAWFAEDDRTDKAFIPKIGITYQASPTVFLFGTVSRGYRAGAYSPGPARFSQVAPGADPETLWNYEVGFKSELFDRHLRLNVTGYLTDISNLQVRETVALGDAKINNAGDARVYGIEGEATAVLGGGFSLDSTISVLNGKYGTLFERGVLGAVINTFDRSGNRMIRSPRVQFSISGRFETDFSEALKFKANVRYYTESSSFYSAANEFGVGNTGWHSLDARAGITLNENIDLYVYGKNLTDKRYTTSVLTLGAYYSSALNDPRIVGAGAKFSF